MKKVFFAFLLIFGLYNQSNATHILGGYMTYVCNGNNNYTFKVYLWRDCTATTGFDNNIDIYAYNQATTNTNNYLYNFTSGSPVITTVPTNVYSPCISTPSNCKEQAVYTINANLPALTGGYKILYQRCCRINAPGLANVSVVANTTGITLEALVPDPAIAVCNNSAVFSNFPPLIVCQGFPFSFDHSAVDADGDLLVYSLCTPTSGSSTNGVPNAYGPVTFIAPYSVNNFIGGTPPMTINASTGQLTATPPLTGKYVVCVCVEEYRNGILINKTFRDFQYYVQPCNLVVLAAVPQISQTCNSYTINFTNASTPINTLSTFHWDFGVTTATNDTSIIKNPSFTYPDTGTYVVRLILNPQFNCKDTAFMTVRVYPFFKTKFAINKATTCVGDILQFSDSSTATKSLINYWRWSFGDGSPNKFTKNTTHAYSAPGTYTVKLYSTDLNGCKDSTTKQIVITAIPQAVITSAKLLCYNNVSFTTNTNANSFLWNFGNPAALNDTSIIKNTSYAYSQSGTYIATLITNPYTVCADTIKDSIKVYSGLNANFSYQQDICEDVLVYFNNISAVPYGSITSQSWKFGDGGTSTLLNPSHTYATPGTYTITFIVQTSYNCKDTIVQTIIVHPYPTPNITSGTNFCYNKVPFTTNTINPTYFWDFGVTGTLNDTSNIATPSFTYPAGGTYTVTLITNKYAFCADTVIKTINVNSGLNAAFNAITKICETDTIFFQNTSTSPYGTINTNTWNFGDGSPIVNALNPAHQYNVPGTYTASLIVINTLNCTDTFTKTIIVYPFPNALINSSSISCSNVATFFSNSPAADYLWNFGNTLVTNDTSHAATPSYSYQPGTYTISLITNPYMNCPDTTTQQLTVYPGLQSNFTVATHFCAGDSVYFTNSSVTVFGTITNFEWDFADGTALQNSVSPTHKYNTAGLYNVRLVVFNSVGCTDTSFKLINVHPFPHPTIISPTLFCFNKANFASNVVANNYLWDFGLVGNLDSSHQAMPSYFYSAPGTYNITLITNHNFYCPDTAFLQVNIFSGLNASYTVDTTVCRLDSISFTNTSTSPFGAINSYLWSFGDGGTSTLANPKHVYNNLGYYSTSLIITNSFNCMDTSTTTKVHVYGLPNVNAGNDTIICYIDTISIHANSTDGVAYTWTPNYNIGLQNTANPIVSPDIPTTYYVVVANVAGCTFADSVIVGTLNSVPAVAGPDTTICIGGSLQLWATGGNTYTWTPSLFLSANNIPNPFCTPGNSIGYVCAIAIGNCVARDTVTIRVKAYPTVNAGPNQRICIGNGTQLNVLQGTYFTWTPVENMLYENTGHPYVTPLVTTTYTVTIIDTNRCLVPVSDSVKVIVVDFQSANAGTDTATVIGFPLNLQAYGGVSYNWSPSEGLSSTTIANPVCTIDHDIAYYVEVTNDLGCIDIDTINIIVFPLSGAIMPNAFSPNGDGLNDDIKPIYAGVTKLHQFSIYNRWGQVMFSTNNTNSGWNGEYLGVPQEIGTYIYIIDATEITGKRTYRKGDISLIH